VVELAKVLTAENVAEVLPRFFHLSKREAKEVSAELNPTPAPTRTVVTPVAALATSPALALASTETRAASQLTSVSWLDEPTRAARELATPAAGSLALPTSPPASMIVEPKTAEQSRIHLTVSRAFLRKLEAARDALSHSHPGASEDEILEAGLDLLLERSAKRKGLVQKPRKEPPPSTTDHVPAHVRRAVVQRDEGRCQWPLEGGGICGSTHRVQLDHVVPCAKGGPSTIENLRCLCRRHNERAARHAFGDAWMDRYTGTG
jgi:hypothetical protein